MSEKEELRRDGATPQKNSGRGQFQKGDGILGHFLVDVKEYSKSFSITRAIWAKICSDAYTANNKIPVLKIVLGEGNGKLRLWIVEDYTFKLMKEAFEEKYG